MATLGVSLPWGGALGSSAVRGKPGARELWRHRLQGFINMPETPGVLR